MKVIKINSLGRGYCDRDNLLLHAAFQILVDFVEKEEPGEIIDWSYNNRHRKAWKEIKSLYRWWTKTRPARRRPTEEKGLKSPSIRMKKMPDSGFLEIVSYDKKKYAKYYKAFKREMHLEAKWWKEDQKNLHRLINIRDFLWT